MVRAVEYAHRSSHKIKRLLFREESFFLTWLVPYIDRFLHGQVFATHVAAVRQAPVGGIWSVEMVVEIVGQVEEPAPGPRRILAACGIPWLMEAYLLAPSSSMLLVASCGTGNNHRFFTGARFAVLEGISDYDNFPRQSVLRQKPRELIGSLQIALV